eukprot:1139732-Pelagomonas_calceolata.AAC.3
MAVCTALLPGRAESAHALVQLLLAAGAQATKTAICDTLVARLCGDSALHCSMCCISSQFFLCSTSLYTSAGTWVNVDSGLVSLQQRAPRCVLGARQEKGPSMHIAMSMTPHLL